MLAKRKTAKKAAIAAVASSEKRQLHGGKKVSNAASGKAGKIKKRVSVVDDEQTTVDASRKVLTRDDVVESGDDHGGMIRQLGDHINTRLREIGGDDDLDADLFDDTKHQLMEEARLAAGTKQRVVSTDIASFLRSTFSSTSAGTSKGSATSKMVGAGSMQLVRIRHNCNSVTAVATLGAELIVFGDKSGKVYVADLSPDNSVGGMTTSERQERKRRSKAMLEPALPAGIISVAISDTRATRPTSRDLFERTTVDQSCTSYIAAGAMDGSISIWETATRTHKGLLFMHRKPITGLSFRALTHNLYSVCEDGTMRVWSAPQMMSLDKLYGHEGKVNAVHALRRETCATVGDDGTMRFWKVDAATQQSYEYLVEQRPGSSPPAAAAAGKKKGCPVPMGCVAMVNETVVVAGAEDGSVVVFDVNRRKPLVVKHAAHGYGFIGDGTGLEKAAAQLEARQREEEGGSKSNGTGRRNPNPITAVAAVSYADVIASASYDGVVRVWQLSGIGTATPAGRRTENPSASTAAGAATKTGPELILLAELPIPSLVSGLSFSPNGDVLSIACAKEPRRGRWVVLSSALNSVCVVPLTNAGLKPLQCMIGSIEHVPAQLYGYQARDEEEEEQLDDDDEEAVGMPAASSDALDGADELSGTDVNDGDEDSNEEGENGAKVPSLLDVGANGQIRFNPDVLSAVSGASRGEKATAAGIKKTKGKGGKKKVKALAGKKSAAVSSKKNPPIQTKKKSLKTKK